MARSQSGCSGRRVGAEVGAGEEVIPVALGDFLDRPPARDLADVDDHQVRDRLFGRDGGCGDPQQRPLRVIRVGPQVHLMRLD